MYQIEFTHIIGFVFVLGAILWYILIRQSNKKYRKYIFEQKKEIEDLKAIARNMEKNSSKLAS